MFQHPEHDTNGEPASPGGDRGCARLSAPWTSSTDAAKPNRIEKNNGIEQTGEGGDVHTHTVHINRHGE
jgi:hypothetical protein